MTNKNQNVQRMLSKYLNILPIIVMTLMLTAATEKLSNTNETENMTIEGVVRDEEGNPVKAATVSIKETVKGTSTDDNGKFKLDGVVIGNTLLVTHKHYESSSIEITGTTKLDFITLRKKDNNLNEVFIEKKSNEQIGSEKRQKLTTTKTGQPVYYEIENAPDLKSGRDIAVGAGSENGSLQRRISVPATSEKAPKVIIRGRDITPMDSLSKPLIILNGVESNIDLNTIDTKTIESMEIFKGESAWGYGFKGRNGVIRITTKKK